MPWDTTAADWLAFFKDVREKNFVSGVSPLPQWELADSKTDTLIGGWSYDDYLRNVQPAAVPDAVTPQLLAALSAGEGHGIGRQQRRLKRLALAALVQLRVAPPLRLVARALPLRLQTRVKSWLRA